MSQGFFAAVSGIKASQSKIDVISDNIANMNTVGFKSSQVDFQTIYSKTLSSGSAPGSSVGGTNPIQIGLGTVISDVTRNFTAGSVQTTNKPTDMYISGNGFFTLQDTDGGTVLSRAGDFTLDSTGNLVNPNGFKVLGTANQISTSGSTTTIKIPSSLNFTETQNTITDTGSDLMSNLNTNDNITSGKFTINTSSGTADITINPASTIQQAVTSINNQTGTTGVSASIDNSTGSIVLNSTDNVSFTNISTNFLSVTGLYDATAAAGATPPYTSTPLSAVNIGIGPGNGTGSSSYTGFSVGIDGSIEASYTGGVKLTVSGDPRTITYSSAGKDITGNGVNILNNAVSPSELQIQMANVINPQGLVSQAGNTFTIGPNAGTPTYSVGTMGNSGEIKTGALEASNVDLPSEFADMILAQRGVDANGRTFTTENQILQTVVNLGR